MEWVSCGLCLISWCLDTWEQRNSSLQGDFIQNTNLWLVNSYKFWSMIGQCNTILISVWLIHKNTNLWLVDARYSRPILNSRDAKSSSKEQEAGALALESLHRQTLPFILRRVKEDVLSGRGTVDKDILHYPVLSRNNFNSNPSF